jgi:hypothetical protein
VLGRGGTQNGVAVTMNGSLRPSRLDVRSLHQPTNGSASEQTSGTAVSTAPATPSARSGEILASAGGA